MATVNVSAEQRVVLHNVDWATYARLLESHADASAPRFTFDRGELEVVSPSPEHEEYNRNLAMIVEILAESLGINIRGLGSTTFREEGAHRGFEPDSCFYIQSEPLVRGKDRLDLRVVPPPDLVIEIDITHPSISKLPIMAEFGVPEAWRYDAETVQILRLSNGQYVEIATSQALPGVTATDVSDLLSESRQIERVAWLRLVRRWAGELGQQDTTSG